MKLVVLAAICGTSQIQEVQAAVGMACKSKDDTCGGDATLCCGIATQGFVVKADSSVSLVTVPNAAICNNKPVDSVSKAVDFEGSLVGAGAEVVTINFKYNAAGFTCLAAPAPPTPDPLPTSGPGMPCSDPDDKCGGDDTLCCGIAMGGLVVDPADPSKPTGVELPNASICNKKKVDNVSKAVDFTGTLLGGDAMTTV